MSIPNSRPGSVSLAAWPGRRAGNRLRAAPLEPAMTARAHPMEVVAADERAVAVEVDANLVPGAAVGAAALIRERRQRRGLALGHRLPPPRTGSSRAAVRPLGGRVRSKPEGTASRRRPA